jgi:hypothetical protein
MMAQAKMSKALIGIGLILLPVLTAAYVSKFAQLKVRSFQKKDPNCKKLHYSPWSIVKSQQPIVIFDLTID